MASRIAVIDHGRVIAEGTKGELKAEVGLGSIHVRLRDTERRAEAASLLEQVLGSPVQLDSDPVAMSVRIGDVGSAADQETGPVTEMAAEQASRALGDLARAGIVVDSFSLGQPSLDEVFLALTDHPADGPSAQEAAA